MWKQPRRPPHHRRAIPSACRFAPQRPEPQFFFQFLRLQRDKKFENLILRGSFRIFLTSIWTACFLIVGFVTSHAVTFNVSSIDALAGENASLAPFALSFDLADGQSSLALSSGLLTTTLQDNGNGTCATFVSIDITVAAMGGNPLSFGRLPAVDIQQHPTGQRVWCPIPCATDGKYRISVFLRDVQSVVWQRRHRDLGWLFCWRQHAVFRGSERILYRSTPRAASCGLAAIVGWGWRARPASHATVRAESYSKTCALIAAKAALATAIS